MEKTKYTIYHNYVIIGLLSLVSVFFLPMLGSSAGLAFVIPNTAAGWIVYITTKTCVIAINLLIFDQFVKQAKVNVSQNPLFLEAERILLTSNTEDEPILPAEHYLHRMYRNKTITTVLFTVLGIFGFTNAILTFDMVAMLSYLFTIGMGIVWGFVSMKEAEEIWTIKHYRYAKKVEEEKNNKKGEIATNSETTTSC